LILYWLPKVLALAMGAGVVVWAAVDVALHGWPK